MLVFIFVQPQTFWFKFHHSVGSHELSIDSVAWWVCLIILKLKLVKFFLVQLLAKRIIKSPDGTILLRVIKNPVTQYLPVGCEILLTSFAASKLSRPRELVPKGDIKQVAIVIGCIAQGQVWMSLFTSVYNKYFQVKVDYPTTDVKISNFPLSAAITCTKVASDFEEAWDIF